MKEDSHEDFLKRHFSREAIMAQKKTNPGTGAGRKGIENPPHAPSEPNTEILSADKARRPPSEPNIRKLTSEHAHRPPSEPNIERKNTERGDS